MDVRESTSRKTVFVEFYDVRDAARAKEALDGADLQGWRLRIDFSRPSDQQQQFYGNFTNGPASSTTISRQRFGSRNFSYQPEVESGGGEVSGGSTVGYLMKQNERIRKIKKTARDELKYAFNLEENEEQGRTTLMIRNIPVRYSLNMITRVLDHHCATYNNRLKAEEKTSAYDFVYLPVDFILKAEEKTSAYDFVYLPVDFMYKCNLGYAFVNFTTVEATKRLYEDFHNRRWEQFSSRKICQVAYAKLQGRAQLENHFKNSKFVCDTDEYLPLVFNPPRTGLQCSALPTVVTSLVGRRGARQQQQLQLTYPEQSHIPKDCRNKCNLKGYASGFEQTSIKTDELHLDDDSRLSLPVTYQLKTSTVVCSIKFRDGVLLGADKLAKGSETDEFVNKILDSGGWLGGTGCEDHILELIYRMEGKEISVQQIRQTLQELSVETEKFEAGGIFVSESGEDMIWALACEGKTKVKTIQKRYSAIGCGEYSAKEHFKSCPINENTTFEAAILYICEAMVKAHMNNPKSIGGGFNIISVSKGPISLRDKEIASNTLLYYRQQMRGDTSAQILYYVRMVCRVCECEVEVFQDRQFIVCSECGRCVAKDPEYVPPPRRDLAAARSAILLMAESLALPSNIKDRAYASYKHAVGMSSLTTCNPDAIKAACLYLACKRAKQPRTLKELENVAGGATEDEIQHAIGSFTCGRNTKWYIPIGILGSYCSELGMSDQAEDAVFEALQKAEVPEGARSTKTAFGLIAAAIYLISLVSSREEDRKSLSDVSRVTEDAEETISECFDILRPQATRLVPEWYCKPEDIKV